MARKVIFETQYTFNPATKTIVFNHYVPAERLILITNVTKNIVIYNFSDPSLKGTVSASVNSNMDELTTVVLNYNTAAMSSTDKLSILIDEYTEKFEPAETYLDSTNKLRVTTPQALIDTDFEYGPQTTKWENLGSICHSGTHHSKGKHPSLKKYSSLPDHVFNKSNQVQSFIFIGIHVSDWVRLFIFKNPSRYERKAKSIEICLSCTDKDYPILWCENGCENPSEQSGRTCFVV